MTTGDPARSQNVFTEELVPLRYTYSFAAFALAEFAMDKAFFPVSVSAAFSIAAVAAAYKEVRPTRGVCRFGPSATAMMPGPDSFALRSRHSQHPEDAARYFRALSAGYPTAGCCGVQKGGGSEDLGILRCPKPPTPFLLRFQFLVPDFGVQRGTAGYVFGVLRGTSSGYSQVFRDAAGYFFGVLRGTSSRYCSVLLRGDPLRGTSGYYGVL